MEGAKSKAVTNSSMIPGGFRAVRVISYDTGAIGESPSFLWDNPERDFWVVVPKELSLSEGGGVEMYFGHHGASVLPLDPDCPAWVMSGWGAVGLTPQEAIDHFVAEDGHWEERRWLD